MIALTRTTLVMHDGQLYAEGGDVKQWCNGITRQMKTFAKTFAPPRRSAARPQYAAIRRAQSLGILQASIYGATRKVGPKQITCTVGARAPHAKYVLNGTGHGGQRYIYSTLGWAHKAEIDAGMRRTRVGSPITGSTGLVMWLPPGGSFGSMKFRVHGQRANPFLSDAYTATARIHSSLPKRRFRRTLL